MRKIFTIAAALVASVAMWADTATMDLALAKGSTPAPSIGVALLNGGAFDGNGYKMGSDGNFIGWNIAESGQAFNAVEFTGYINTTSTEKNWAFQFSTDGGTTWSEEVTQANDGDKSYHAITVSAEIPEGANALRIIRRAGTSAYVSSITLTLGSAEPSTDPVTAAEISGENACLVGGSVELTCTAAKATNYQWYLGGVAIDGATAKKYTFTPSAAGTFSFTCEAWNENNTTHVVAAAHEVSVMDPANACGELIKATTQGTVSGVIGGTYDTNNGTGSSKKLDKKKYYGLVLQSGTFRAGDVFHINVTSAAGLGKCMLYGDEAGTDLIIDAGSEGFYVTGELQVVLPAAATGKNAIYLYREDGNTQWNPTFDWISVTRSCEASNNANLDKVWVVNGEENMYYDAEEDGLTYNLTVPASVDLAEVDVYFSLAHPLASANVSSPLHFTVPAAGQTATETVVVTAQDGTTTKTYTINVTKSDALSNEAHLASLSVAGYTLDPAFAEDVFAYTITKAYGAENPGTSAVSAGPKDPAAHPNAQALENALVVTVTAEDGETQLVYTINIVEAAAPKKFHEIIMSNGYNAYIPDGYTDIYAYYLEGEAVPTIESVLVNEGSTWAQEGNTLTLTGADEQSAQYALHVEAVTPMVATTEEITLDGTETWIKGAYGFDAAKGGWKFSKTDSDYSREIAGKTHVELFLPATQVLVLKTGATGTERNVALKVNGEAIGHAFKLTKAGVEVRLNTTEAFMLTIESAQTGGDGAVGAIQLKEDWATAIDNNEAEVKAVKRIVNGQLLIEKNGVLYNAQGAQVR